MGTLSKNFEYFAEHWAGMGATCPGPPTHKWPVASNLRNSLKLSKAPSKSGECKALRAPFSGILNAFWSTVRLFLVYLLFKNNDVIGTPDIILPHDGCNLPGWNSPNISWVHSKKTNNLFKVDENSIEQCCAVHKRPTLFNIVNIVQHCWAWNSPPIKPQSGLTTLNNTVDNIKQCGHQNIVQFCFMSPELVVRSYACIRSISNNWTIR